ncbi:CHAD domain-containing protein [Kitasatospora sp. NBC_01287]|uniref:CYTH and CHAD domain-containing protein n=1 Tax=Kitasatospora sp. NBC_01287 TaxID=2903573 RepID=UPI002254BCF4|nr:CHAD domain-containing protein [Kitasatospora sp. NBC_01287]MCX4751379.1 CHAD domain-containing protein [Kitasatospora sp. NBC_01287]
MAATHAAHPERALTYRGLPAEPLRLGTLPRVAEVVHGMPEEQVRICHDTPELRLLAHGRTLTGPEPDWCLTLPDGTEHHAPPAAATPSVIPAELADRLRAYTGGRTPHPVLRLRTRHARTRLFDAGGRALAELDRAETLAQPLHATPGPVRLVGWTRTEVRLVHGRPRLLAALDAQLRAQGLTAAPDPPPTALLARRREPAARRVPARRVAPGTAGAALAAYLRGRTDELLALDAAVRRDEPDAVHRMRVCCRRLRSALTAGRRLLRRGGVGPLPEELRWLGQVLGRARDAEATGERLAAACAELPPAAAPGQLAAHLTARFRRRYADARLQVLEVLDSERYFELLDALGTLAERPPLRGRARRGRAELARLLRREQRRTGRRLRAALAHPAGPGRDEALHRARKAAKRARYTAELAGRDAARLARRMRDLQEALGGYQDAVTAERLLPQLAAQARADGEDTFGYGVLFAAQRPAARAALRDARPAGRRARARRLTRLR